MDLESGTPVHRGNIGGVVLNPWNDTCRAGVEGSDRQTSNRKRSTKWIDSLATRFAEHYAGRRYRLFWSGNDGNREQFGINEILFDLAVCSVSAAYARSDLFERRRTLMADWAHYLTHERAKDSELSRQHWPSAADARGQIPEV